MTFDFPIDVLYAFSLPVEAGVVCYKSNRETALLLKKVKRTHNLGDVLLPYVLIYNLEVSFHFHLTFLQLNVTKMFTVQ